MIAFIDTPPKVEPKHGMFLVTAMSGNGEVQLILTRHALMGLQSKAKKRLDDARCGELGFVPTPFSLRQRAKEAAES